MAFSADSLLAWYDRHRRRMPWRALPGETPDPYRVWLSEIMLQQTTVTAVVPYFERFVARFPTVQALAAAEEGAVMAAWAGLGYYARARNLHACAKAVAAGGGAFPASVEGLRALPGVGPYTANAVAAIAFNIPVVPVDGNVERITARLFAVEAALPGAKAELAARAATLNTEPAARARAADFCQALFDLGATVCTARPACGVCPWVGQCEARRLGIAAELPRREAKTARPVRHGAHFWLEDAAGQVLLRRRPPAGLLGGMTELPGTVWRDAPFAAHEAAAVAPMEAAWQRAGAVRHVFTHFELRLDVYAARVAEIRAEGFLRHADALAEEALPSLMRKCVRVARPEAA
ncbi:MAG TPA: A/G-specific adenine glycosylase [Acetobacteraceae bacterium]|nr:A/G-specific adenine glycosylase [Acetobacteraceae bacterium]